MISSYEIEAAKDIIANAKAEMATLKQSYDRTVGEQRRLLEIGALIDRVQQFLANAQA